MDKQTWMKIERVLDRLLDKEPSTWPNLIHNLCGGDVELQDEVEILLRRYPHIHSFLGSSSNDSFPTIIAKELRSEDESRNSIRTIGKYRILDEIARGGMGRVFLAERADGHYKQRVALKLLQATFDTDSMRRRFRTERQILASLNHPGIARLLDGGVAESAFESGDSVPYLVMEYVEGRPVTQYCHQGNIPITDRLRLFKRIAEAVQHAHRNLIVHCDIKPSNILVTEEGNVKLLDFGIARMLDEESEMSYPITQTDLRRWMTPEYAAPEQISGDRVTTSTDVYQLGVLLYELLTDCRPFDRGDENIRMLEKNILEKDPVKPSLMVTSVISRNRLQGDLDAIILKALRKEPDMRYESVAAFLEDITRYVSGLPVSARRGNIGYRMGKYVRRHRVAVVTTIGILLLTVFYIQRLAVERDRAEQAAARAIVETETAQQVTDFLMGMFEAGGPDQALGEEITAHELLDRGVEQAEQLTDRPEVQARMLHVTGRVYMQLGEYQKARPLLERALVIRESLFGSVHEQVAVSLNTLATLYQELAEYNAAESLFRRTLAINRELFGDQHEKVATSLNNLGLLLVLKGEYEESESLYREALAIERGLPETDGGRIATKLNNLAGIYLERGEYESAERLYREVLELYVVTYGEKHRRVAMAMDNLAKTLVAMGRMEEAKPLLKNSLLMFRELLGDDHPSVATLYYSIADFYYRNGELEKAEENFQTALQIDQRLFGDAHPNVAYDLLGLGRVYLARGDADLAEAVLRDVYKIWNESYSSEHWLTAKVAGLIGSALTELNRFEEAEPLLLESYSVIRANFGMHNKRTKSALERIIEFYESWNRPDRAAYYSSLHDEALSYADH
jgi:eukaryotic-like serine/threonine-protein kinase